MADIETGRNDGSRELPTHARAVIIGGGVVGCSILFHLSKFGWKDVVLLERSELTSGSSWHAAGQIHTISSDPNISRLQSYTINLYREIEELSGQSIGLNLTGGFYLASNRSWYDYLKRERSKARYMGLSQEFISPAELAERHPLIDPATTLPRSGMTRMAISTRPEPPMPSHGPRGISAAGISPTRRSSPRSNGPMAHGMSPREGA